jgi:midasin (ATPase involved in ribosome maturation)
MRNGDLLLIDEISLGTLLALLVQKYKYCPLITAMHNGELLLMDEISRGSQYADVC